MHHFKIAILEMQDIFVAKQQIIPKTLFKAFKCGLLRNNSEL